MLSSLQKLLPPSPSELQRLIERELCRRSLAEFIRVSWPHIDPSDYVHNWHIDATAEHLQAVSAGQLRRLIINIPPRSMKSSLAAVAWPAWDWIATPERKFLFSSYAQSLSTRDSLKCRRLIQSPWYQAHWGDRFALAEDQNLKMRFDTDKGGYRLATSVGGALTGEGGDVIVLDDPHHAGEAESEVVRESTIDWFDQVMSTRLNDPKTGAFVIVMQRLHERDLTGHLLAKNWGCDHLCLPMRHELKHPTPVRSSLGWRDPRTREGELLWPDRLGESEVAALESALGPYGTAGQLQQRPSVAGGNILKSEWWQDWGKGAPPAWLLPEQAAAWREREPPECGPIFAVMDTAHETKTSSDYSACTIWGAWTDMREINHLMLLGAWRERLEFPDLVKRARKTWTDYDLDEMAIEDKASGISLRQELRRQGVIVTSLRPDRDKQARAHSVTPIFAAGHVWAPRSTIWAGMVIEECSAFPRGQHDDLTDTVIYAVSRIRRGGYVQVHEDERAKPVENSVRAGAVYA